jgi:di/tricarboxylate transporter
LPELDQIIVLAIVVGTIVLFVTEKLRVDVAALCVLACLLVLGVIGREDALYGFSNSATATVAAMFILSAGLVRTGFVQWLARHLDKMAGRTETGLILALCITIAVLSAFIVNTATVAIFIPVAIALARSRKIVPSRILIPLSFSSQFGGVCTLIGTSTNILVNSMAIAYGMSGFRLFEFTPLGIVLSIIGILYLLIFSHWLLPKRKGTDEQIDKYKLADYLAELKVNKGSPLIGNKWRGLKRKDLKAINLIKIIRGKKTTWRASETTIREGDLLLVHGNADELMKMKDNYYLETRADSRIKDPKLRSDEFKLIEALVPPRSSLVRHTLGHSDFRRRYGCMVLAIQRRGKILRDRLEDIHLDDGDTLLLQCENEAVNRIKETNDLIVTSEQTELQVRKDRVFIALAVVLLVVGLAAFNIFPILVAAIIGAVGMVLGRCLTIEEAYKAIDWKVIFLLGGILPLGLALEQTGTAAWLANEIMGPLVNLGPLAVLAALYLITAMLTETMSNNAAAVLLVPIAISVADNLSVSARPFLMAITFAASTSFATPVGYQTNTMIYAPGGYHFFDYARIGVPLNILFWGTTVLLAPMLWPF